MLSENDLAKCANFSDSPQFGQSQCDRKLQTQHVTFIKNI